MVQGVSCTAVQALRLGLIPSVFDFKYLDFKYLVRTSVSLFVRFTCPPHAELITRAGPQRDRSVSDGLTRDNQHPWEVAFWHIESMRFLDA